ncbi:MAG: N-acetylmuramoyl-L-alanine amidase [bacterium]
MIKILLLCILVLLSAAASAFAGSIQVVYPVEGSAMPSYPGTFILGNVSPSTAPFYINSSRIEVYKNGAFLAYLPISNGNFAFNCELKEDAASVFLTRTIKVGEQRDFNFLPGPAIDPLSILPSAQVELRESDWLQVYFRGTPGKEAGFSVPGLKKNLPMSEIPAGSGFYYGAYRITGDDECDDAPVKVFLKDKGRPKAKAEARGTVTVSKSGFRVVETSTESVILRNGPSTGYMLFLPQGVRMLSDGKIGRRSRIRLSETESGWAETFKLRELPAGAHPPEAVMGTIKTIGGADSSTVAVSLSQQIPFAVDEDGEAVTLTLYYTKGHTNWIVHDSSDTLVDSIRWKQDATQTCRVFVKLREGKALWGYNISYSGGRLLLELRTRPAVSGKWPAPLKGLRAVIDPGHSLKKNYPFDGAIGPTGLLESAANLGTALELEKELAALGAEVVLTRRGDEEVALTERPKTAWACRGDIYVSLHNNALPDGENPFAGPRGFSVYYYQPHSRKLAEAVHRSYVKDIHLPDEYLRYGDYHVIRMTQMPAILVESAYLMFPEQEEMLADQAFLKKLAAAVRSGILDFLGISPAPSSADFKKVRSGKTRRETVRKYPPGKKTASDAAFKKRKKSSKPRARQ